MVSKVWFLPVFLINIIVSSDTLLIYAIFSKNNLQTWMKIKGKYYISTNILTYAVNEFVINCNQLHVQYAMHLHFSLTKKNLFL